MLTSIIIHSLTEIQRINIANWCSQWEGPVTQCMVRVAESPAATKMINYWHGVITTL